jgi:hypothetical protein
MRDLIRNERGMALAIVLLALIIVGALVAAAMFSGTQEQRVGENEPRLQQSFGVAEAGAVEQIRTWNPATFNTRGLYPLDSLTINSTQAAGGTGSFNGTIYKMNGNMYLVAMTGSDKNSAKFGAAAGGSQQRIGVLTKILPIQFSAKGAIVTTGNIKLANNLTVTGVDQVPPTWNACDPPGAAVPGIHLDSTSKIGYKSPTIIAGSPPTLVDNLVNDSTFTNFGAYTYSSLSAMANIILPAGAYGPKPAVTNGTCDQAVLTNWGDGLNPAQPCGSYFPVIHVQGNLSINTGVGVQGQGILLVDGNFQAKGPFTFFGIVIVQGNTKMQGTAAGDNHIWGTVISGSKIGLKTKSDTLDGTANANFGYSSCAILRATQGTALTTLMRSRSWSQLF